MAGRVVVLLGQGEQYDDPDDWRELVRNRRIRRGVELAVRRDGLTTFLRPEEAPELARVLDEVDAGDPSARVAPPAPAARDASASATSVPPTPPEAAAAAAPEALRLPASPPSGRFAITARPRRRGWGFGVWLVVFGVGVLLLLRLCGRDGLGPGFGAGALQGRRESAAAPAACARPRGWIAKAACDDAEFARLRTALANAYADRAAGLDADERTALAAEQARWQASRGACRTASDPAACLAPRYRARIAELREARAAVAPAEGTPPAGLAAAAAQAHDLAKPEWVRQPTRDEMADAFPERASRLDIDGRARLACRVTDAGLLSACDILEETPPDYGFGGAALRLARYFQLRPATSDGRSVEGARVEVPVTFKGG